MFAPLTAYYPYNRNCPWRIEKLLLTIKMSKTMQTKQTLPAITHRRNWLGGADDCASGGF